MHRRHLVTSFAVALTYPAVAFAQNAAPGAAPTAMGAMGEAERRHAERTMTVGSLSLASSRVALKKAEDKDVKEFAEFEVAEQETIADILKSMMNPALVSGSVKAPSEKEVEANLDAKGKEAMAKLSEAKAGAVFDKDYVTAQIDGHEQLLKIQDDYLAAGKDPAAIAVAKLARGMIKEHLTLLSDIKKG